MKISVIMPVYNAEATLSKSLESLAAQTFRDFEIVFVNDGSTDGTLAIIEDFKSKSDILCKIISQENAGVAAARNAGLDAAEGDYLAFVDADDMIESEAFRKAIRHDGADIIGWDWTLGFEKNGRYMRQADYSTPIEAVKNLMGGVMRWNLWLFMYRREFISDNNLRFIAGANMGEDMMFTISAFLKANEVAQIHESLYRYNAVSTSSISRQFSDQRRKEVSTNFAALESRIDREELKDYLQYLKLFIKLPLLISSEKENYELWYNWFPESNSYAMANKAVPFRTRFLQWMASKRFFAGVKFYYTFAYKFVYGVIFR